MSDYADLNPPEIRSYKAESQKLKLLLRKSSKQSVSHSLERVASGLGSLVSGLSLGFEFEFDFDFDFEFVFGYRRRVKACLPN
ncbi:GH13709 [Drosophila grimshawi]|uniref:GH13709 n=1 Tax=Drosophila grimshawi TaxID=7222 RepID=B4JQJ7_DROGR|nr:GH13709 [Drosophila grimshawi]